MDGWMADTQMNGLTDKWMYDILWNGLITHRFLSNKWMTLMNEWFDGLMNDVFSYVCGKVCLLISLLNDLK